MANKAVFFDMIHSNNAARIRLWRDFSPPEVQEKIETKMTTYANLRQPEYAKVNPLRKVPALVREDGRCAFESSVILNYLEERYNENACFLPDTPEQRQEMHLIIRLHDLYVASPNSSMPGFSHSQGAMYLTPVETEFVPKVRSMPDKSMRSKKIAELWNQLSTLEEHIVGPYIMGDKLTLADFTWFPTTIFMESMLPKIFGWPDVFRDPNVLPKFSRWWTLVQERHPEFSKVRDDIYGYWEKQYALGQFDTIIGEVQDKNYQWSYPVQWEGPTEGMLNYQEPPPEGKTTGRYIGCEDKGDVVDVHIPSIVTIHDGRQFQASLDNEGFSLVKCPSKMTESDYTDPGQVETVYYDDVSGLIKRETGAKKVFIFDYTIRNSQDAAASLNAADGSAQAAPVPRVHCDYTETGAPRRLRQFAESGELTVEGEAITPEMVDDMIKNGKRFAFINIWKSIDQENPVLEMPLALCDPKSVPELDRFTYELRFPDRTGENYSLRFSNEHKWYSYPKMTSDECVVFKVFDTIEPKFVFHTAFKDPRGGFHAPARRSIEVRTIAFFD
jgi:glutathione S-transferase